MSIFAEGARGNAVQTQERHRRVRFKFEAVISSVGTTALSGITGKCGMESFSEAVSNASTGETLMSVCDRLIDLIMRRARRARVPLLDDIEGAEDWEDLVS